MKYKKMSLSLIAILMAVLVFGAIKPHLHRSHGKTLVNPDIFTPYISGKMKRLLK